MGKVNKCAGHCRPPGQGRPAGVAGWPTDKFPTKRKNLIFWGAQKVIKNACFLGSLFLMIFYFSRHFWGCQKCVILGYLLGTLKLKTFNFRVSKRCAKVTPFLDPPKSWNLNIFSQSEGRKRGAPGSPLWGA